MRHALSSALCCLLASTSARADPPSKTLQLTYSASGPGASTCPDEAALRKAVYEQLWHDPFRPDAPYRLTAAITAAFNRRGREFTAAIQIQDTDGRVLWTENRLTTMAPCTTLVLAVADAIAGWVHEPPRAAPSSPPAQPPATPPPPPAPVPPPPPTPARPALTAPLPNASARSKPDLRMGLYAMVNVGVTPAPTIGAAYVFELRPIQALSVELAARGTLGASTQRNAPIQSGYLSGAIAPCVHIFFAFTCPVLEVGALGFQGPSGMNVRTIAPVAVAAGGRVGGEWTFLGRFSPGGFMELKHVPTVSHLKINQDEVWRTSSVFFSVGLGLTMRLW